MKKYIGVKLVEARPMTRGEYNIFRGWTIPENEDPSDKGYKTVTPDGLIQWQPKQQFKETHRPTDGMTFGMAIEAVKKGFKIARIGWNGKGVFLLHVSNPDYGIINEIGLNIPAANILPWIGIKTADNKFVPWLPSQADMLADDWQIVE